MVFQGTHGHFRVIFVNWRCIIFRESFSCLFSYVVQSRPACLENTSVCINSIISIPFPHFVFAAWVLLEPFLWPNHTNAQPLARVWESCQWPIPVDFNKTFFFWGVLGFFSRVASEDDPKIQVRHVGWQFHTISNLQEKSWQLKIVQSIHAVVVPSW